MWTCSEDHDGNGTGHLWLRAAYFTFRRPRCPALVSKNSAKFVTKLRQRLHRYGDWILNQQKLRLRILRKHNNDKEIIRNLVNREEEREVKQNVRLETWVARFKFIYDALNNAFSTRSTITMNICIRQSLLMRISWWWRSWLRDLWNSPTAEALTKFGW